MKHVEIIYYAALRDLFGVARESVQTTAVNCTQLWEELCERHARPLSTEHLRVAVDDVFVSWDAPLPDASHIAFMPPFAGG